MRSIVTDRVEWSVCEPGKTDESIEMRFGFRTRVDTGNHVLDGGRNPQMGRGNSEGEGAAHCKV